jgi:hypothetical protein
MLGKRGLAMQIDGNWRDPAARHWAARPEFSLLARFAGKFVLDILPAALASVIGGFLFTQYQLGRAVAPAPAAQMSPASAEVLALVRDEHEAIVSYLTSQMAAEKSRLAAQDAETALAVADAKAAQADEEREQALAAQNTVEAKLAAAAPARHLTIAAKVALPRAKPAAGSNLAAPLEVAAAQADPNPQQTAAAPTERLAHDPDSLLAKTLDLKDHVVAATKQAVAALGDMFASVGERIGGSAPSARPFNSDS